LRIRVLRNKVEKKLANDADEIKIKVKFQRTSKFDFKNVFKELI
jgi:hypothetical protein